MFPFKGAKVGENLFWLDGLERFVYIEAGSGPRFSIYFLVNAGRKPVDHACLPEPMAVYLTMMALSPDALKMASGKQERVRGGVLVEEFHLVFEKDPALTAEQLLAAIKNDPNFVLGTMGR